MNARAFRHHCQITNLIRFEHVATVCVALALAIGIAAPYAYAAMAIVRNLTSALALH